MKYILFTTIFFSLFLSSHAQTKKETEDWIVYNLGKYFGDDYSYKGLNTTKKYFREFGYNWHSYSYSFRNNKFEIYEYSYNIDSAQKQKVTGVKIFTFDLKKVKKLEIDTSISKEVELYRLNIEFVFQNGSFDRNGETIEPALTRYDVTNKKDLTSKTSYEENYNLISYQEEAVINGIGIRLKKAFEHLITING